MPGSRNGYKTTIEHRLSVIETQLNTILTNHLPHLHAEVEATRAKSTIENESLGRRLDTIAARQWWVLATVAAGIISVGFDLTIHGIFPGM